MGPAMSELSALLREAGAHFLRLYEPDSPPEEVLATFQWIAETSPDDETRIEALIALIGMGHVIERRTVH